MSVLENSFSTSQLDCALPCNPSSSQSSSDTFSLLTQQTPHSLEMPNWVYVLPSDSDPDSAIETSQLLPDDIQIDYGALITAGVSCQCQPQHHAAMETGDPLLNRAAAYKLSNTDDDMLFYTPVADVAGLGDLTETAIANGSTIVAGVSAIAANDDNARPEVLNITNLPQEIFAANPGLDNAVANDGRDDADTIQTVINWVKAQQTADSTRETTIYMPEGTFDLAKTLKVNTPEITFKGAGTGRTILQTTRRFDVGTQGLPDGETVVDSVNRNAYLFDLKKNADDVSFVGMTLTGPDIHGAIFGNRTDDLTIKNVEFNDFLWSSVRLFSASNARIHDSVFIDAGGQADNGVTGGSIFATYLKDSEIYNNRILKSVGREDNVYGIKGRQFKNTRIYNNTIKTNFAIELPFEHDSFVEIDHNFLGGVISVPKFSGGKVPKEGYTFHIHHNYFNKSYSLEWARNGAEVDHNVFVFDPKKDNGNLISNFDSQPAQGPTKFHHNLILNPGRGIAWHKGVYNNFSFYNNEVIANKTATPRKDGLFGFNPKTDFSTIEIRDNVIKARGTSRPLMRNRASYGAVIENNQLVNISDANKFDNPTTGKPRGLGEPLLFQVGVGGEFTVDGAELSRTSRP